MFVTMMGEADGEDAKLVYSGWLDAVPDLGDLVVMQDESPVKKWFVISKTLVIKQSGNGWILIVGQSEC